MKDFEELYQKYVKLVYRICFLMLNNVEDAQDATQTIFLKLLKENRTFENEEHEKAYLIRSAKNQCKDYLKYWWRAKRSDMESEDVLKNVIYENPHLDDELLTKVLELSEKYRIVLYLYYYEGYKTNEIAKLLNCPHATIRGRMKTAREMLKRRLEETDDDRI